MVRSSGRLSLEALQHPDAKADEDHRPQLPDPVEANDVEIVGEKESPDHNQSDSAPKFFVLHFTELLVKSVDRRFQFNAFDGQLSFLGGVVRLKGHVEIKRGRRQTE